jgi:16S rRNA (guanine527-N7)-methyltransferase
MQRRTDFLTEVVTDLSLDDRVRVVRGRADDQAVSALIGGAPTIVARAVAPLERLLEWCLPLLGPDGRLLALKGRRAEEEIAALTSRTRRRVGEIEVVECGRDLPEPTRVVVVQSRRGR